MLVVLARANPISVADIQGQQGADLCRLHHILDLDFLAPRADILSAGTEFGRRDTEFVSPLS